MLFPDRGEVWRLTDLPRLLPNVPATQGWWNRIEYLFCIGGYSLLAQ